MTAIRSVSVNYQLLTCHILGICNFEKMTFLPVMSHPEQNPHGTGECNVIENYVNLNYALKLFGGGGMKQKVAQ